MHLENLNRTWIPLHLQLPKVMDEAKRIVIPLHLKRPIWEEEVAVLAFETTSQGYVSIFVFELGPSSNSFLLWGIAHPGWARR